jgi:hypothetical protein
MNYLFGSSSMVARNFLPQLDIIQARNNCTCGCPSIEFNVPVEAPYIETPQAMRACFTGRSDEYEVGLMLVAGFGVLSELEIYVFGENEGPFGLPEVGTIKYVT